MESRGYDFLRTEAWLTLVGSKSLDTDFGNFIPKQGPDHPTADKFAKMNKVKTINEVENQQSVTNKNTMNKAKT